MAGSQKDTRPVLFFDVDDCLYPKSLDVETRINKLVDQFLVKHLSLSPEDATQLNFDYYKDHGLTVIGLQKLHDIDPMLYNAEVDDALPLDEILSPDKKLQAVLEKFDRAKVKLWLFTNAYVTHGRRVVKLLGIEKFFEGITYCDYKTGLWPSKPYPEMFEKAEQEAGVAEVDQCYFVDDSPKNCKAAFERGWHVVRLLDPGTTQPTDTETPTYATIKNLEQLHDVFPRLAN